MHKESLNHITDAELLKKFYEDGNTYWLGIILERYTLLLYGVCLKYLKDEEQAKDTVQQIFLKAIAELQKYRVEYFKSWLYTIAKNQCLMQLRKKISSQPTELANLTDASIQQVYDTDNDKEALMNYIEEGLNQLNEEQKTCVTLFYLQNVSYQQISAATGYNLLQVKSYIQNGKRNLKLFVDKKISNNNA